jgi:hypothetical protein
MQSHLRLSQSVTTAVSVYVVQSHYQLVALWYPCRKAPDGEGSETYDHWEMRIHKRLLEMDITSGKDESALRQVARIPIPDTVSIELSMRSMN